MDHRQVADYHRWTSISPGARLPTPVCCWNSPISQALRSAERVAVVLGLGQPRLGTPEEGSMDHRPKKQTILHGRPLMAGEPTTNARWKDGHAEWISHALPLY